MRDYRIIITQDEMPESPREWDNLGIMICKHSRYSLGDVEASERYQKRGRSVDNDLAQYFYEEVFDYCYESEEYVNYDGTLTDKGVDAILKRIDRSVVVLPLYLYDHSGITMNTTGFRCPWDSGQVGIIYVTHEKLKQEFGWKRITEARHKQAVELLKGEVTTYDQYLTGDVWGYTVIAPDGEEVDSCWGFYGEDYCREEAESVVRLCREEDRKKKQKKVKALIKNKVPLTDRVSLV